MSNSIWKQTQRWADENEKRLPEMKLFYFRLHLIKISPEFQLWQSHNENKEIFAPPRLLQELHEYSAGFSEEQERPLAAATRRTGSRGALHWALTDTFTPKTFIKMKNTQTRAFV